MYYNNFEGNYIIDMTIKKNGKIESCKKKIPLSAGGSKSLQGTQGTN